MKQKVIVLATVFAVTALWLCVPVFAGFSPNDAELLNPSDEGWRWRSNVRIRVEGEELNFDALHKELNNAVQGAENGLKKGAKSAVPNICTGGLSVIFKKDKAVTSVYTPLHDKNQAQCARLASTGNWVSREYSN